VLKKTKNGFPVVSFLKIVRVVLVGMAGIMLHDEPAFGAQQLVLKNPVRY
jgi:hypothetical protein